MTGSAGADTIEGGAGTDTIIIAAAGKGDSDTMDGGADGDVLQLSAGAMPLRIMTVKNITMDGGNADD